MRFNNPILKRVVNVYQTSYVNKSPQGFGDYIRGCYCLYQICRILGLEFAMDLGAHPMSKYLLFYIDKEKNKELNKELVVEENGHVEENNKPVKEDIQQVKRIFPSWVSLLTTEKRNEVAWIPKTNYIPTGQYEFSQDPDFVNYVIKLFNQQNEETFFVYCNSLPVFHLVTKYAVDCIRPYIQPSQEVIKYCYRVMKKICLVPKHFGVIHIRTGDHMNYKGNTISYQYANKILKILLPLLESKRDSLKNNNGRPTKQIFLVISDNNSIKPYFFNYINCVYYIKGITHLGISDNGDGAVSNDTLYSTEEETNRENDQKLLDTLLDFYIMQYANTIISLTPYQWGSGFSEMAATTYGIPYKKIII
jgi:hypothetical protein